MRPLKTKYNSKFHSNTFLELQTSTPYYVVGEKYSLIDYSNDTLFVKAILTEKQTVKRSELTNIVTQLNNDVDVETHNKIDSLYRQINQNDLIDILIFRTIYTYIKPYEKLSVHNF